MPRAKPLNLVLLITRQEFVDCIKGKYPNLEEATEKLKSRDTFSVAFNRVFALVKDSSLEDLIYLYHKQDKVGFIMNGELSLAKKARCLKESLREAGIKC
jgi:hypothetical protein